MTAGKFRTLFVIAAMCVSAQTAAYPDKPVTVVVPFPPGGSSDIVARTISAKLKDLLGQPIVIENRPGANGSIGAGQVARAKPDGYTILVGSIGVLSVNSSLYKSITYDPKKDFDLLTLAVRTPNVLVVRPDFPANTVGEFVQYLKKNPDKVSFASTGIGGSDHLSAALFWQKTGTTGINATFNGSGPTITALLGGHADASFRNLGEVTRHIKAGKMKLLATTAGKRLAEFPEAPTMAEAGVDGMEIFSWQGIAAPKGLPKDVADKLSRALIAALKDPGVTKTFNEQGFEAVGSSPAEFTAFQAAEAARWKATIDAGKITVE